jgi:hypothetical protein
MLKHRRLLLAATVGLALILAAGVSDFVVGSFWERHGMLTSLVANLLVVGVTVVVINQVVERRDRRRWTRLAQTVLFALIQSARATWTGMLEVLELADVKSGSVQSLLEARDIVLDAARVGRAADEREDASAIVPLSWWAQRTAGLAGSESPPPPLSKDPAA